MKENISVINGKEKVERRKLTHFLLAPLSNGLFGFALFFTILLFTKLIAFWIGSIPVFNIDSDDILLSGIGFVLMAIIKVLENFQQN